MNLPAPVLSCIDALERTGFETYAVGGCVRDALLGLTPHDYDLCTAAPPDRIKEIFQDHSLVLAGEKHGTVGVVTAQSVVEITAFRSEGAYRDNRHPDEVRFVSNVHTDLARRDFTVNAMAYSPQRGLVDPFGGQADLEKQLLRAVGDPAARFQEDALRILRCVRFAVRYNLTVEPGTARAAAELAGLLNNLARERVYTELCGLLPLVTAEDVLRFAPILTAAIPELSPTVGFDQRSPHHAYDLYTHTAHVTGAVPGSLPLRWAALLHDIGKISTFTVDENGRGHFYGHARRSAELAEEILRRLHAPNALRERVVLLISQHMTPLEPDKRLLRRRLGQYGAEAVTQLLALQRADFGSKGTGQSDDDCYFDKITVLLREIEAEAAVLTLKDLAVNGRDLLALGIPAGPEIGKCLDKLLKAVQDETLPNTKEVLLCAITGTGDKD